MSHRRESGQIQPEITPHSDVIRGKSNWFRMLEWHQNDGMRSNDRNEIKKYPIFTRHLRWRNELRMTGIAILTTFLSSQLNIIPRHSYDQMTIEWMEWHPNDSILSSWTMIAGMTLEWKNNTQMVEWHSNDGMTPEWCFKVGLNIWMSWKWWNDF